MAKPNFRGSQSVIKAGNMLYPELEQKLEDAKILLNHATSENIVDRCRQYLQLLAEYRVKLYKMQDVFNVYRTSPQVPGSGEAPDRLVMREAIETTTRERNRVQVLLLSFTTVSGYEAVDVLNQNNHEGHQDWELRASGVKFPGGDDDDLMTIQEAVDLAGQLRREDQVAQNLTLNRSPSD